MICVLCKTKQEPATYKRVELDVCWECWADAPNWVRDNLKEDAGGRCRNSTRNKLDRLIKVR